MLNTTSLSRCLFIFLLTLWSTTLFSAPAGSTSFSGTQPTKGTVITITGSGFGTKSQAAPILYDLSDKAYVNGSLDNRQGALKEGAPILRTTDFYWAKSSNTSNNNSFVEITYNQTHRNSNITAHYTFDGFNGYVGWPYAYGGTSTSGNNKKLYASWWYKPFRDPRFYWRWDLADIKGTFITGADPYQPGEKLIIDSPKLGVLYGEVIALKGNQLHFIATRATSSTHLRGANIEGATSGATALLPNDDTAFLAPGSNKFIRVWEDLQGKNGYLSSWTQMNTAVRKPNGKNIISNLNTILQIGRWNHLEVEIDLLNNTYREWVNNKLLKSLDITQALRDDTKLSPTIALLGFNGKEQQFQRTEFGEIYMDNTPQRIVLANSPVLSNATRTEIQLPESWSDTSISFKLNLGSFATGNDSSLYVFVFDENGISNNTGMQLCPSCAPVPDVTTKTN